MDDIGTYVFEKESIIDEFGSTNAESALMNSN